jgi:hypothetical protein
VAQGLALELGSVKLADPVALMVATVAAGITQAADQAAVLLVLAVGLVQAQERELVRAQGLELVVAAQKVAVTGKAALAGPQTGLVKAAAVDPAVAATKVVAREAVAKLV